IAKEPSSYGRDMFESRGYDFYGYRGNDGESTGSGGGHWDPIQKTETIPAWIEVLGFRVRKPSIEKTITTWTLVSDASGQGGWDSNGDGKFQKSEADSWWLKGGGDVSVNNAKINWSGLKIPNGKSIGDVFPISTTDAFLKLPYETAATYGGTSFKVIGPSQVMVLDQLYHYKYRPNNSAENIIRNFMNWYGKPEGQGTDFMIHYYNPNIQIK
ncbi:MAG: hypothetical protein Q8N05_12730, partial [Bacteroidota bacterium]|nr:hypothetical protein [Bacteroidota bacterium]